MMKKTKLLTCFAGVALLAGCAQPPAGVPCRDTPHPTQCRNQRRDSNLVGGALIGGAGGAIIGALTGNAAVGAAIGAGAGALGGAIAPEGSPSPRYQQPGYQGGYGYQPNYQQPGYQNGGYGYQGGYRTESMNDCHGVYFKGSILNSCS